MLWLGNCYAQMNVNILLFLPDAEQLENFDIRPSGMKDKQIIKYLIDRVDSYSHFIQMISKLERGLAL